MFKKLKGRFLNIVKDVEEGLIGSLDDTENCVASWSKNPHYCVRVTANDGKRGDQFLEDFKDNEKIIPTILTTSQLNNHQPKYSQKQTKS